MQEFKGTEGEWEVIDSQSELPKIYSGEINIADIWLQENSQQRSFPTKTQALANAKLIAASPDLLTFAIDFVNKVESGRARSTDSYNKAKIAINKAIGD